MQSSRETGNTPSLIDSALPSHIHSQGTQAFKDFVTSTYHGLIHWDEQILEDRLSDLRVFCRIDVSVLLDSTGKYQYFANEVEASHGTALFLHYIGRQGSRVAADFATAFRTMVALRRAREAAMM
jgi:hypothetical protein